jgi:hypothetical protein
VGALEVLGDEIDRRLRVGGFTHSVSGNVYGPLSDQFKIFESETYRRMYAGVNLPGDFVSDILAEMTSFTDFYMGTTISELIGSAPATTERYLHRKTGNVYDKYRSLVHPFPSVLEDSHFKTAFDSENKDTEVKVYYENGLLFFSFTDNPGLTDNLSQKVLYKREGVLWLRSVSSFLAKVAIDDKLGPRFLKIEDIV